MSLRRIAVESYLKHIVPSPDINPLWPLDQLQKNLLRIYWPTEYQWAAASDWVDLLKYEFSTNLKLVEVNNIPQPYKGTVVFRVKMASGDFTIAIGYSDYLPVQSECAEVVDLYFKMQFDPDGYTFPNVVPGGYIPDGKRLYYHLKKLRKLKETRSYAFDVSGRFSLMYSPEIRQNAVERLVSQTKFQYNGGLEKVTYLEFLREVARSKINIDLPGLGPFCFRLINYLAIGTCVVSYPHKALMHVPLEDRKHIVYCREDMSDLVELCDYYLRNDDEREQIAGNARIFFDENLHKSNLARYYLHTILERLG